jgi:hypothetical protein
VRRFPYTWQAFTTVDAGTLSRLVDDGLKERKSNGGVRHGRLLAHRSRSGTARRIHGKNYCGAFAQPSRTSEVLWEPANGLRILRRVSRFVRLARQPVVRGREATDRKRSHLRPFGLVLQNMRPLVGTASFLGFTGERNLLPYIARYANAGANPRGRRCQSFGVCADEWKQLETFNRVRRPPVLPLVWRTGTTSPGFAAPPYELCADRFEGAK